MLRGDLLDHRANLLHGGGEPGRCVTAQRSSRQRNSADAAPVAAARATSVTRCSEGSKSSLAPPRVRSAAPCKRRGHHRPELLQVDRFGQVVVRPRLERLHGVLGETISRDDDRLSRRPLSSSQRSTSSPLPSGRRMSVMTAL